MKHNTFPVAGLLTLFFLSGLIYSACDKTDGKSVPTGPTAVTTKKDTGTETGEVDNTKYLTVTSIAGGATAGGTPSEIDLNHISDCDGDPDTIDPEPGLFDDEATVTIINEGTKTVEFTEYTIKYVARDATSAGEKLSDYRADISVQILGGASAGIQVTILKFIRKADYVSNYNSDTYVTFDAFYTFTGTSSDGDAVTITGSLEIKLGAYNYC